MNSMEPSVTGPMYVVWEDGGRMGRLSSRHEYVPKKKYLFCSRPNQDSRKNDVNLSKTWKVAFLRWCWWWHVPLAKDCTQTKASGITHGALGDGMGQNR